MITTYNLITTITELPTLVGCKEFPNSPDGIKLIKLINDFINDEYKYDASMVKAAFKMAAKQELYLDNKRIDPSTFGQHLSINVVGKVLTAYKEFKRSENARPKSDTGFLLNAENDEKITPKEAYEYYIKWTKKDGKVPTIFPPFWFAYDYMVEHGIIEPVKERMVARKIPEREVQQIGNILKNPTISSRQHAVEQYFQRTLLS